MDSQKEGELFNEMAKLNRGTRRRLLRRTAKKYKESLKQWHKLANGKDYINAVIINPEAYLKTTALMEKIRIIKQITIWFDEDQASKFDKKQLSTSYVPCCLPCHIANSLVLAGYQIPSSM